MLSVLTLGLALSCEALVARAPAQRRRSFARGATPQEVASAVSALESEVVAKTRLQAELERELDAAIGDAAQAEAEMRVAREAYEEAQTLGAKAEELAQQKAKSAAETKLETMRANVERAAALVADAEAKTSAAVESATAGTRRQIALAEEKAEATRQAAAPLQELRDEQIQGIEEAARQKIETIEARAERRDGNEKRIRNATYAALAFAALDGCLLVGDRLHFGFPAALGGAAAAVAAMVIWGTA